jgi:thioredoxin-related protein
MLCLATRVPLSTLGYLFGSFLVGLCVGCGDAGQTGEGAGDRGAAAVSEGEVSSPEVSVSGKETKAQTNPFLTGEGPANARTQPGAGDTADTATASKLDPLTPGASDSAADQEIVERDIWINDFELAKSRAVQENKDILMDFTGSDWCTWCIRLRDEVFRYRQFVDFAEANFVLLELDFPRDSSLVTEEERAQNADLQSRFAIQGFPTILLADAQGRPYSQTGYQEGGPSNYVAHLASLKQVRTERDKRFSAAQAATGTEKARMIHEALSLIPPDLILPSYEAEVSEVVTLDENNEAGLGKDYKERLLAAKFRTAAAQIEQIAHSSGDVNRALEELGKVETEFAGYSQGELQLKLMRMQLLQMGDRSPEAVTVLDDILTKFNDNPRLVITLLVSKAEMLMKLNRPEEARASFNEARKVADPQLQAALDTIEQQLFPNGGSAPASPAEPPQEDR